MEISLKGILLLTILIVITNSSCKDEEPRPIINPNGPDCIEDTINLGQIDFTSKADEWKNYTKVDKIFFVNAENEEISFSTEFEFLNSYHSYYTLSIECKHGDLNKYSLGTERWAQLFGSTESRLKLSYRINIHPDVSANLFVDNLGVLIGLDYNINDTFNVIRRQLNSQSLLSDLNSDSEYSLTEDFSEFHENIELLGKTFSKVYENKILGRDYLDRLYINKDIGIVGFSDLENMFWVFDRIE